MNSAMHRLRSVASAGTLGGLVHHMCVVGRQLWTCYGDGNIEVYDVGDEGLIKVKVSRLGSK